MIRRLLEDKYTGSTDDDGDKDDVKDDDFVSDDGEIQKYEAVVFVSVLIGMVACCLFSCAYKRIQMSLERSRRRAALEQMLGPSVTITRNNVFSNSLVENGEDDWACALCGFTNRPRTFECNLCGLDRDKLLLEFDCVSRAARELMEGRTVTAMSLTDRQLRGARRLLWRRELRLDEGGYHGTPLGSGLDSWKWVRNTPPPLSQDTDWSAEKSLLERDIESGEDGSFSSSKTPTSPRKTGRSSNPLFSIFGSTEAQDSLKSPLIDSAPTPTHQKSILAKAKSMFSKPAAKPLIFDSISRFAFVAVALETDEIMWVNMIDNEYEDPESEMMDGLPDAAFIDLADRYPPEELFIVCMTSFRDKHRWFEDQLDRIQIPWAGGHMTLHVSRDDLLQSSMESFHRQVPKEDLRMFMRVNFVGESGIDVGGVEREWFLLTVAEIFSPEQGFFEFPTGSSGYRINPAGGGYDNGEFWTDEHALEFMEFTGKLLAKALMERQALAVPLTTSLLKHLLGAPCCLSDLSDLDPELAKHISWLLQQSPQVIDSLHLDFTVNITIPTSSKKKDKKRQVVMHELKPNGVNCEVTSANLDEYVTLLSQFHLGTSVERPLCRLLEGFYTVMPPDLITVFDYAELEFVMCGSQTVDVEDWKRHTHYGGVFNRGEYNADNLHPVCVWFWEVVADLGETDRMKLFQFVTGGSKVPAQGFKALQRNDGKYQMFTLEAVEASDREGWLPVAHTCFNRLDLPVYKSKDELTEAILLIVSLNVTGFSMD